ncbi:hypothetical protein GCM10009668_01750 [Nocardioides dubius]|uniref:Cardiolipin synthase N-terminal domain-containing protein n=2 Tax=Nocardioides dubius TaxID=317019 RepID=A0ABN1TMK6_9ACTN
MVILLLIFAFAAIFIVWLVLLIEAVRTPTGVWQAAGQNQVVHILLMVVLGALGTLIYALTARPQLRSAAQPIR